MSSAPSWAATYSLIKKQKAKYAKGRSYENENIYTNWYGLNGEPFCFMFVSWILAHAGSSEAAGLALIGGKKAYVPNIRNIKGYKAGHSGMKVGAIVAVNNFNHIGFCTALHSNGTFELYSGNTTYAGSDDAVWPKTYPLSYASGHVNLAYGSGSGTITPPTTQGDDFMADYLSIDKTSAHPNELTPNVRAQVWFDKNNNSTAKKNHADGNWPSIVQGGTYYTGTINLRIKDLPKGSEGQIRCVYLDQAGTFKAGCYVTEFVGSSGDTFVSHPASGYVPAGQKMRVEVVSFDPNAKPSVVEGYVRLYVKGA